MIYWILSDMGVKHGRRHDGNWDDVERFHRHRDAVAKAKKLRAKGCYCKPLKQEGIVLYWRLPERAGEKDLTEIIEFRSRRQADAWTKRAIAEGCEVIECLGLARPHAAKRKVKK
jgi:hypothetical protein